MKKLNYPATLGLRVGGDGGGGSGVFVCTRLTINRRVYQMQQIQIQPIGRYQKENRTDEREKALDLLFMVLFVPTESANCSVTQRYCNLCSPNTWEHNKKLRYPSTRLYLPGYACTDAIEGYSCPWALQSLECSSSIRHRQIDKLIDCRSSILHQLLWISSRLIGDVSCRAVAVSSLTVLP